MNENLDFRTYKRAKRIYVDFVVEDKEIIAQQIARRAQGSRLRAKYRVESGARHMNVKSVDGGDYCGTDLSGPGVILVWSEK